MSSAITPSGRSAPKAQGKLSEMSSAAASQAAAAGRASPARATVMTHAGSSGASARTRSDFRHSSGTGAAISPARSIANSAIAASAMFGSWIATTARGGRPSEPSCRASRSTAASAPA
jgi:hypothetical protein